MWAGRRGQITAEQQQEGGTWDEAYDNGLALITNC